ncbi:SUMF1/EgtB/PvdO family nonheme iron enzyme [Acinetobacter haemolyticus]|uniref:SUMF1/EgtB/PvdO family nonheme iron enzyme n=1 Tax=Acinetobacter haemolyticus TaxID=29430 RepID=UPI00137350DE|nr:SUMF1/EgtB/PvdO family nonheme iron enzyme [Acinetobacter haemolyticus]NAR91517.1 SUMF1/EgtB/PvdO family nonheme iron enzyme [Acinetobacter haemolyticus]
MAKQKINQGTAPTGVGGDTFRTGSAKLQANDDELYTHLGAEADGVLTVEKTRTKLGVISDKSELTILIKDSLRQSVELASGGLQTVLYTAKGQATYMNIIQKYDMSTIDASLSGTHPAFIVDGVEKPEIFIGTYQGRIVNGELLSLPNVEPSHSTNYGNFLTAARACGNGHHLITNAEWSAVALQCYKNNTQPMGNSYYGRSSQDPLLIGRRADGLNPGDTSGSPRTLTGSGPVQWRHNGKENGIADLSGNVWEWNSGMRIFNGEIQVIADNNASKLAIDLGAASTEWKAIDGETGNLVTPNGSGTTAGTIKYANGGTADYTINGGSFGAIRNLSTTKPVTAAALARLKALCLYPHTENTASYNGDYFAKTMTDERLPFRGGYWSSAASAGVFALNLNNARSRVYTNVGARPAFVNL